MDYNNNDKLLQEALTEHEGLINQDDYLPQILQKVLQEAIRREFASFIGADEYERTGSRVGYRNGSYTRHLRTRVGTLELNICRDRAGKFQPSLFERYQRSEKALILTIVEMYFKGVSTRKVTTILEQLCGLSISKSQVSRLVCQLDNLLKEWRERPLITPYMYLLFDARYEKVRINGRVVSRAVVVGIGITKEGYREIIGCWVINSESFESWNSCFKSLRDRGLTGVEYVVSDENPGLRKALMKHFQDVKLQRCQVYFMRNFMSKLAKSEKDEGIKLLKEVFDAPTKEAAKTLMKPLIEFLLSKKKDKVVEWLEESIEDAWVVFDLPSEHRKQMKSTNMLERVNQELKRRSRVVRIFPNEASCLRLATALCQEISEGWGDRRYLTKI